MDVYYLTSLLGRMILILIHFLFFGTGNGIQIILQLFVYVEFKQREK